VLAHLMATLAFVLLLYGMLALYARLEEIRHGPSTILGLGLSLAGIALIMPMLGVETLSFPSWDGSISRVRPISRPRWPSSTSGRRP
jgi:hypothetical protein